MNDRAVGVLSEYDLEVLRTWKGRGAILFETPEGLRILKEYTGSTEKLALQSELLSRIRESGEIAVEELLPNREGALWTQDQNQSVYIVKTCFEGRECNIRIETECRQAAETLAGLHRLMRLPRAGTVVWPVSDMGREYDRHNRELKRVRGFLRKKSPKNDFELSLLHHYDGFLEQALAVTEAWRARQDKDAAEREETDAWCHGEYQHHNLLLRENDMCVVNFEKCARGGQIRDLYLFLRKLLEKNNWSAALGDRTLEAYHRRRALSGEELCQLYYRFAYPEKFWKIVNFYYNTGKAWIPGRNMEKLEKLLRQEADRQSFLRTLRGNCMR